MTSPRDREPLYAMAAFSCLVLPCPVAACWWAVGPELSAVMVAFAACFVVGVWWLVTEPRSASEAPRPDPVLCGLCGSERGSRTCSKPGWDAPTRYAVFAGCSNEACANGKLPDGWVWT